MPLDILTLGEPLMELSEQGAGSYHQGFGGDVSNMAVAAARQGASVGILTRLGRDAFGDRFMELWTTEGIDTRWVERSATEPTGTYLISYEAGDHRFTYYRKGSAASALGPDHVTAEAVAGTRTVHLSGIAEAISTSACDATLQALELAKEQGTMVSFDPNLRLKLWPLPRAKALLLATAAMADICLPSLEDARALLGPAEPDALVDQLLDLGAKAVVLKLGADGALVASAQERARLEGWKVELVDATGAGDTFDGALLAELARGVSLADAARYANAAAALSTRGRGAVGPIPRRSEVAAFLSDQNGPRLTTPG
ncbi:MAG TPA: sugar kinase [Trueperaceae bacterium]|nr:sugar kinase [Trueperaceae bacterium]